MKSMPKNAGETKAQYLARVRASKPTGTTPVGPRTQSAFTPRTPAKRSATPIGAAARKAATMAGRASASGKGGGRGLGGMSSGRPKGSMGPMK
jgi:hypothetical protein